MVLRQLCKLFTGVRLSLSPPKFNLDFDNPLVYNNVLAEEIMKIKIPNKQPRNPFVAAVLFRKAGRHCKSNKQLRAQARSSTRV